MVAYRKKTYKGKKKPYRRKYRRKPSTAIMRPLRQPFANITKRVLPYSFRDQLTPPNTSLGGFSVTSIAYSLNSPFDIDPTAGTLSTSARINHQSMGYDQLEALYNKRRVDWAKIRVNFAVNRQKTSIVESTVDNAGVHSTTGQHLTDGPIRVALLVTDDSALDTSSLVTTPGTKAFEKLIEQSRSGQLPNGVALKYKVLMPGKMAHLEAGINCYKFFKRQNGLSYSDWKENNTGNFTHTPQNHIYCHIIASPISVNPGDQHPKVTFFGDMSMGMTFTDLKQFGQS
jgi:hypothetical protein